VTPARPAKPFCSGPDPALPHELTKCRQTSLLNHKHTTHIDSARLKPALTMPAANRDKNFDGDRAFLSGSAGRIALTRYCASCRITAPENRAPEKKPVPFRSSGLHSLPRREVSQKPMRCFPASRKRCEGTLLMGRKVLLPVSRALPAYAEPS